ncbi:invasion associated locus B family protein [Breoghania sp.]|uniref:invasion associated locus B family protein n=1 Tax=Breoghania sp. TaxID=2065378 RepID=UPI002AA94525|nr:invasion associated locus B family protein [Breoghania sp.]
MYLFSKGHRVLASATLALSLSMVAAPALSQEKAAATSPARLWSVTCADAASGKGSQCQMVQTLAMKNTGQRLLTIAVQKQETEGHPRLIVGLPHGVFFPGGVSVAIDEGKKSPVTVQTSDANGAYATETLDDKMLEALRKGSQLNVEFESGSREKLEIPVSLKGFAEAYQRVSSFGG